jgi:uncharacterized protein (DUF608 family)
MRYPRVYTGRQLAMLAMPLGGIAAGSISLGGRGQLRDWELFNRPDKGRSPEYAFASIWAQAGSRKPVAHVLEARLMPPYEGPDGLGSKNAPGLTRLEGATFTGEFPIAQIALRDSRLPVNVSLDAFSPFRLSSTPAPSFRTQHSPASTISMPCRRNCERHTAPLMTPWISSTVLLHSPVIVTAQSICSDSTKSSRLRSLQQLFSRPGNARKRT